MGPYPDWNHGVTPHTDPMARVRRHRLVTNRRVIQVTNASHRNATLDGVFELEDQIGADPVFVTPQGKTCVRVICAWYGVTADTTFPRLDLTNADYELASGYTGEVADDIY
jgi:hypothetical protein